MSHELKTPLALVRMFGEMLQSGRVASEAKRQEYLDIIVSESERLSALIENVLDFARVERGRQAYDFADGDVGEAVAKAVNVYRYRAEREGVELAAEIEPDLPRAHIDERAIQLAVINLIDNALKYAPGRGRRSSARPARERPGHRRARRRPRPGRARGGARAHLRALRPRLDRAGRRGARSGPFAAAASAWRWSSTSPRATAAVHGSRSRMAGRRAGASFAVSIPVG